MHPHWNQLSTAQQQVITPLLKWATPDRIDQFVTLAEQVNAERDATARLASALEAVLEAIPPSSVDQANKQILLLAADESNLENCGPGIGE